MNRFGDWRPPRKCAREFLGLARIRARHDDRCKPPIRRQAGSFADAFLLGEKAVAVAFLERLHQWMVRQIGLDQGAPWSVAAPCPARHLCHQLPGSLAGARIAQFKRQIGIDDAGQCQMRKMMALGDKLRADDEIILALGDIAQRIAQ